MRRGAIALAAIATAGCAGARPAAEIPKGPGPLVGTYKAELSRDGEPARRARLVVWAEAPDRLHAELLPPVGGARLTLDAGGGRAVLVDASERTAYAGDAGPAAIAALTGVEVGVGDVVAALLEGTSIAGGSVERADEPAGRLPSRFALTLGGARIALTLVRWERASREAAALGTAEPPAGWPVRPLHEWGR